MKKYNYTTTFKYQGKKYWVHADTLEELYTKKANRLRDLEENTVIYDSSVPVDSWADIAFDTYKGNVQGLDDIKKRYKKYVGAHIGTRPIGTVKAVELQAILNDIVRSFGRRSLFFLRLRLTINLFRTTPQRNCGCPSILRESAGVLPRTRENIF